MEGQREETTLNIIFLILIFLFCYFMQPMCNPDEIDNGFDELEEPALR